MVTTEDSEIASIAYSLDQEEWTIMANLERTRKTDSRYFSEIDLGKKKPCWTIDINKKLKGLQKKRLVSQVDPGKKLWEATSEGFLVEHFVSKKELERKNPGLKSIRRG